MITGSKFARTAEDTVDTNIYGCSGNGKEKWAQTQALKAKNDVAGTVDNLASQTKVKVQDAVNEVKKSVS